MDFKRPALGRRFAGLLLFLAFHLAPLDAVAQSADEFLAQARAAATANNNREAARLFEQAIRVAPERRSEWLLEFADQLAYAGRPGEAVPLYRERLADPALSPEIRRRAERSLAFALLWSNQFEEAIPAWRAIAEAAPGDAEARKALADATVGAARAAAGRGANREAAALFESALTLDPARQLEIGREYADQLAFGGEPARAVPLYRERLARTDLPAEERQRTTRALAFALVWSSQFQDAIPAWEALVRDNPGDEEGRRALADALVGGARQAAQGRRNADAAALFRRAIETAPMRRQDLLPELADQTAYAGRPADAVPLYQEALRRGDRPEAEQSRLRRNLAFALLWGSRFQEAVGAWEAILRGNANDEEGRKALSDALAGAARQAAERRRNADATALFRRAIETAPGRRQELLPEYADQTAYAGRPGDAVPLYQEALRQDGRPRAEQRRLRRGLAFALLWSGRSGEAIPALEGVLAQDPDDAEARRALADARAGTVRAPTDGASPQQGAPAPSASAQPAPSASAQPASPAPAAPATPADKAIAEARAAAGRGANKEAAALFARAVALDPSKRREVLREYADQVAYSGEPARAVPLYREALRQTGLQPEDRRTTNRALSFALLWSSQWDAAIEAWTEILRADRNDQEARKALSDALVGAAREAAGKTRNAEAANLFRRAIDTAPGRRQELLPEFADQLAYSGQPRAAVVLYREGLRVGNRAPAERQRLQRGLAFALLWSNQWGEAIEAWRAIVRQNPRDQEARKAYADALVGGAREAAGQSRNGQSAALFAQALAVAPERRPELLREYADQVLYSGQPLAAIPLYQEVLQRSDLAPVDLRAARLGLARAYSWSNQPTLGLPFYTAILLADPADLEALIGRGQALNAVAAHRGALADFEAALRLKPDNADALRGAARAETSLGLHRVALERITPLLLRGDRDPETLRIVADARRAMGRPDLSEDAALAILAVKPDDEGARRLLDDLLRERRPLTQIEASQIRRSDDLRITGALVFQEFTFDRGLTKLAPQIRMLSHRGGFFPDVDVYSVGLRGRRRFNDWLELKTDFFVNSEEEPDKKDVTFTHETTLSLIPDDVWRLNLQAARRYPDENPVSIVRDVFQNDFGGSVEFTPSYDLRVTGRGFYSSYTDGNERVWGQLELARRVSIKPDILLGARLTAFDFKEVLDNGYWNPDRYQSAEATFQSYGQLTDQLFYDVQLAGGWAWTQPGTDGAVYAGTARVTYQFHPDAAFSLFANHLTSHVRSGETGGVVVDGDDEPFRRNVFGAQLQVRLGGTPGRLAADPTPLPAPAPLPLPSSGRAFARE
jgi:tetratricopeptide (TPR) repeat protein